MIEIPGPLRAVSEINSNVKRLEAVRQERLPHFYKAFKAIGSFLKNSRLAEYTVDLNHNATRVEYCELDDSSPSINGPFGVFSQGENDNIIRIPLLLHEIVVPGCRPVTLSLTGRVKSAISGTVNQLAMEKIHDKTWTPGEIEGFMGLFLTSEDALYFNKEVLPKLTVQLSSMTNENWQVDESKHMNKLSGKITTPNFIESTRPWPDDLRIMLSTIVSGSTPYEIQSYSLLGDSPNQTSGGWPVTRFLLNDAGYGMAKANAVVKALDAYLGLYGSSLDDILKTGILKSIYGEDILGGDWIEKTKKMFLLEDLKTRINIGSTFLGEDLSHFFGSFFSEGVGSHPYSHIFKLMKPEIYFFDGKDVRNIEKPSVTSPGVSPRSAVIDQPNHIGNAELFIANHENLSGTKKVRFGELDEYGISSETIRKEFRKIGFDPYVLNAHIFRDGEHYYPHHYDVMLDGVDINGINHMAVFSMTFESDRRTDKDHQWDGMIHLRPTGLYENGKTVPIPDDMKSLYDAIGYYVLVKLPTDKKANPFVRIDSVCMPSMFPGTGHYAAGDHTGLGCDCANQRLEALEQIYSNPGGGISILTPHSGRGSGTDAHFGQLNVQDYARRRSLPIPATYHAYAGQGANPDSRGDYYWLDAVLVKSFAKAFNGNEIQLLTNNNMKGGALDIFAIPNHILPLHVTDRQPTYYNNSPNFRQKADEGKHTKPKQ